jgi:hypothetical protein
MRQQLKEQPKATQWWMDLSLLNAALALESTAQ